MSTGIHKKNNIHEGHRERMRKRAVVGNTATFSDHELLEIVLYNTILRGNTNPTAHNLLQTFGSLKNVLAADIEELKSVQGVGDSAAVFIKTLSEIYQRALREEVVIKNLFTLAKTEKAFMICADKNYNVIATHQISESADSGSVKIDATKVCNQAVLAKAKFVVLVHNHLFGSLQPSESDFLTTKEILQRLYANGILVLDHVIIQEKSYLSFRENGILDEWLSRINGSRDAFTQLLEGAGTLETIGERVDHFLLMRYL